MNPSTSSGRMRFIPSRQAQNFPRPRFGQFSTFLETREEPSRKTRVRIVALLLMGLAVLGITIARLVDLTVVHGAEYRTRADENRFFVRPIPAPRGVIFDRSGEPLTRNIPATKVIDFPGDNVGSVETEVVRRSYPFGATFAHLIGYVGEVDEETLRQCQKNSLACTLGIQDVIGKTGLEKWYDGVLRGTDGSELIEVDANGKFIRALGQNLPISGKDLHTTFDRALQEEMVRVLGNRRGAVVALDPAQGDILGMTSGPSFDPNLFVGDQDSARSGEIQKLLSDQENLPLFDRTVGGEYPPGSIFKLVTASAGLSEGKVTRDTTIEDTGEIRIGDFRYGNWYFDQYGRKEGSIGLSRAITRSNDIFFYRVGEWVGPERLASWAKKLGLGEKTGIDIAGEADGLVPDPLWKERTTGERWFLGNTYHMAIGQGDVRVTPLQIAQMAAAVVTGNRCTPHIAIQATGDLRLATSTKETRCRDVGISDENRALILQGMVGACAPGGTGFPFFEWNEEKLGFPLIACKTGTAQHGGEKTKPHAWMTVAGPIVKAKGQGSKDEGNYQLNLESDKRIILVVLLEDAGEGSAEAAPVAKEILETWFGSER